MILLVVDTSVARAASGRPEANHPSPACTRTLRALERRASLGVAMSRDLKAEWQRHATPFAMRWLGALVSRKRVKHIPNGGDWPGAGEILAAAAELRPSRLDPVKKDEPLWGLAMATDRRVLSNDNRQRELLRLICGRSPEIGELAWVDGSQPQAVTWLEADAPL
ncbi:MAG TPA: hypothetical protein PKA64_22125, partial [Myxococcota bacterium]|nr:hypothetical protein [Myxococcota bacterium]